MLDLDETVKGPAHFRAEWLRKNRLNPGRCTVIGVSGESMEPTLPDGCSILVDPDRTQLREEAIVVVRTGDGVVVRRTEKGAGGRWITASDHAG